MSEHGLTKENFLRALPISLSGDPKMAALAEAIAGVLEERRKEIDLLAIYPNVAQLGESLLDILARDFKVDWWDSDYSLEEKRRTLLSSWQVHKLLGTKAAVELAASAVYPITTVQEWFEYGGEPYYFRLNVQLSEGVWDNGKHKRLMQRLQYYKNLRSHLDSVVYKVPPAVLENQNRLWFVANIFRLGINNLGEETVRLNGRRNLDGSWPLSVIFTRGAAFHRLLMSMMAENLESHSLTWAVRAEAHMRGAAALSSLQVCHYSANNLGVEAALLNGKRPLDGGWYLTALFSRGVSMNRFVWAGRADNRLYTHGGVIFRARAPTACKTSTKAVYKATGRNVQSSCQCFTAAARAQNRQQLRAVLTARREHKLDGGFALDGTKKLNSGTERSEI